MLTWSYCVFIVLFFVCFLHFYHGWVGCVLKWFLFCLFVKVKHNLAFAQVVLFWKLTGFIYAVYLCIYLSFLPHYLQFFCLFLKTCETHYINLNQSNWMMLLYLLWLTFICFVFFYKFCFSCLSMYILSMFQSLLYL